MSEVLESMDWNAYQLWALSKFTKEGNLDFQTMNAALGLAGESGEVCDLVKKNICHHKLVSRQKLIEELGDVLYYLAVLSHFGMLSLADVAAENVRKLNERYPDGFDPKRAHAPQDSPIGTDRTAGNGSSWPASPGEEVSGVRKG